MEKGLVAKASVKIKAPVNRVWNALINPALIKQYMFGTEVLSDWKNGSTIIWKGVWKEKAYEDKAFPIGEGQTISQPYTVAYQSQLLELKKFEKVLEIGTGSAYQACVLAELGVAVYTIERQKALYDFARNLLPALGFRPQFFYGDGYRGLPTYGPFDKIIVTAGASFVPEPLKQQLKVGGIMVIPVGKSDLQIMKIITRISETEYTEDDRGGFVFVPLLAGLSD